MTYTEEETKAADEMAIVTQATLAEAFGIVERCRGVAFTPERVLEYGLQCGVSMAGSFEHLLVMENAIAHQLAEEPGPTGTAHSKENGLLLREPQNKAERRLIQDIQTGIRARDAAMGQLARANRKVAKAEQGLRQAGMVTGGEQ